MSLHTYSSLDQTSSLETFENKKPIEENKPTMVKVSYNGRLSQMDFVYKFFEKPVMSSLAG